MMELQVFDDVDREEKPNEFTDDTRPDIITEEICNNHIRICN